ncbi:MAG: hypothetical protein QOI55_2414 [Actinomycetota bacterium]|nr:hypothetical protein [Actinomycetota bacterium]
MGLLAVGPAWHAVPVRVEPVDPRDQRWEAEAEAYRVYFWSPLPSGAWRSEEFEITDADVAEVLAWAEREASGRLRTVYVRIGRGGELGLVRLSGTDPTSSD